MPLKQFDTPHGRMLAFTSDRFITPCLESGAGYAPEEWAVLAQLVRPGMTVVEVGANIGVHAIPLARACAPGRLYVFEPQQRVFQVLCANVVLNGLPNVTAYPQACGEAEDEAIIPWVDYEATGNFGGVSVQPAGGKGQKVRVVPLDSLGLSACGLIKIDAEGFEPKVLAGAAETIARCRPIIYTENDRPDQQQAVISMLDGLGYRLYWHTPALAAPEVFGGTRFVSVNMLCMPRERGIDVPGTEPIDPANWVSPVKRSKA